MTVVREEVLHLALRESESLVRGLGEDVVDLDVVKVGEQALLGDLHNPGDVGHLQAVVVLHGGAYEPSQEVHYRSVGLFPERVGYGYVVLVYEDDDLLSVMSFQDLRYFSQGGFQLVPVGIACQEGVDEDLLILHEDG